MKPEVKKAWVDALRSGEYRQGMGQLLRRNESGLMEFCCLGVLCQLAVHDGAIHPPVYDRGNIASYQMGSNRADSLLPDAVAEWAGIPQSDARITTMEREYSLARLNDALKWDFKQIADYIEENL